MKTITVVFTLCALLSKNAFAQQAEAPTPLAAESSAPAAAAQPPPAPATAGAPAGEVRAAPEAAPRHSGLTLWGSLPWGGYGIGARYMTPLAIPSLLRTDKIRDSWALEFGLDYLRMGDDYGSIRVSYSELLPVCGMMWTLWFSPQFAIYPKIEAGYAIAWFSTSYGPGIGGYGGPFVSGAGGVLYRLASGLTLRAEAGISGLKGGVAWTF